jgi:hypothetical protein
MHASRTPNRLLPVLTLAVALLGLLTLSACTTASATDPISRAPATPTEFVSADVLANPDFVSTDATVVGIKLGMSDEKVLEILGPPDRQQEFDFGAIANWEYGERLGVNGTAMTVHLRSGIVTRILIFPRADAFLAEPLAANWTKAGMYSRFGSPDRTYDIKTGQFYVYNRQGLEVYADRIGLDAIGLVYPMRKLPTTATFDRNETNITNPVIPRLILDTTTLCAQGLTYGFDPVTSRCEEFAQACDIPDHWVEVRSCEAEDVSLDAIRRAVEGR